MAEDFTASEVGRYFRQRLPNLRQGRERECRGPCPIHGGERDSFAVDMQTGRWHCHSECGRGGDMIELERELSHVDFKTAREAVFRIVGRSAAPPNQRHSRRGEIVAVYQYQDEQSAVLFEVVRFDPKDFRQRVPDANGSYRWKLDGIRLVPFRLPQVLAAQRVFLVEGEKDALALEALGFTATCNPMGAGKWRSEYCPHFAGREVLIVPDDDEPGRKHAAQVAAALIGTAASVRIVELPGAKDAAEWIASGGTREALEALAAAAFPIDAAGLETLRTRWGLAQAEPQARSGSRHGDFTVTDSGVYWRKWKADGTCEDIRLSSRVDVLTKPRDSNGRNWGRLLGWRDADERAHQWAMPCELLASDSAAIYARLLGDGLSFISSGQTFRNKFLEYIQTWPCEKRARSVAQIGWAGAVFVLPDTVIGAEAEAVFWQSPNESDHTWNVSGTLEDWREAVGRRCSGNSRLILAVSTAFAGPLLKLASADESGGIHFYGSTSTGKSTALIVAGSVLGGGPARGFVQTWRATSNGLEVMAELHNDATLVLDELAQMDAKDAAEIAYLLGNGQGKARMSRSIGARRKLTWTLLFLSAGELTLAEHSASAGKRTRGGVEVRLLNIPADAGAGLGMFEKIHGAPSADAFARELKAAALSCYGTAFRAFLEAIIGNRDEVAGAVRAAREAFIKKNVPPDAPGEVRRAALRFALIGAAGEIATEHSLTGWQPGEAIGAAERCFSDWMAARGTCGASDDEAAVAQVRLFFERHGTARFQKLRPGAPDPEAESIRDRAGFRQRGEDGTMEFLVLPEVFRSEVCQGLNYRAALKALEARGYLRRTFDELTIKPRLPELGPTRVYCIRGLIGGEDAELD